MKKQFVIAVALLSIVLFNGVLFAADARTSNKEGLGAYKMKDYKTAKAMFSQAIELDPNYIEAKLNLSVTLIHLEEFEESIKLSRKIYMDTKSYYVKSDAYFNGRKACEIIGYKENVVLCAGFSYGEGAYLHYRALLEKKSKEKYILLEGYISEAALSEFAKQENTLTTEDIEVLKNGKLPNTGNAVVGFIESKEMLVFVHDSDLKGNSPSVAIYNDNGELFIVIDTKEIYPDSGTYIGSKDFGQLNYRGTTNTAFYVDRGNKSGQVITYARRQ